MPSVLAGGFSTGIPENLSKNLEFLALRTLTTTLREILRTKFDKPWWFGSEGPDERAKRTMWLRHGYEKMKGFGTI